MDSPINRTKLNTLWSQLDNYFSGSRINSGISAIKPSTKLPLKTNLPSNAVDYLTNSASCMTSYPTFDTRTGTSSIHPLKKENKCPISNYNTSSNSSPQSSPLVSKKKKQESKQQTGISDSYFLLTRLPDNPLPEHPLHNLGFYLASGRLCFPRAVWVP